MAVWENNRKFAIGKQRLGIMVETNDRILPVGIQSFVDIFMLTRQISSGNLPTEGKSIIT